MPRLSLELGLAVAAIIITIVLVVLDKAEKLRGGVLLWLLVVAALMTVPLALGNPLVAGAPSQWKWWLRMIALAAVGFAYWGIAIWITSPEKKLASQPTTQAVPTETEALRRQILLARLRNEYILSHGGLSAALLAGIEQPPAEWINGRLKDLGEKWTLGDTKQQQMSDPPKADEKPIEPTLSLLMNGDFPGLHKLHGKPLLQFADGASSEIEDVLYVDFKAGSKFVGIYVPSSSKSIEILSSIVLSTKHLGDELSKSLQVVSKGLGENPQDIGALVYTGRVYLYHQDHLTHRQIADIEEAATKHNLNVIFRGPDYLTQAWLEWKRRSEK